MIAPLALGIASTLPLGPAGFSIVNNTVVGGKKRGIRSLIELQLVELSYLAIGILGIRVFQTSAFLHSLLEIVAASVLLIFGGLLFKRPKQESSNYPTWILALLNPGIILLYLTVVTIFEGDYWSLLYFQLGSILAISGLVFLAYRQQALLERLLPQVRIGVGILFIIISLGKFISLI